MFPLFYFTLNNNNTTTACDCETEANREVRLFRAPSLEHQKEPTRRVCSVRWRCSRSIDQTQSLAFLTRRSGGSTWLPSDRRCLRRSAVRGRLPHVGAERSVFSGRKRCPCRLQPFTSWFAAPVGTSEEQPQSVEDLTNLTKRRNPQIQICLYKTYVRSVVENGTTVFDPLKGWISIFWRASKINPHEKWL